MVESLTSYITRLANSHGVCVSTLLSRTFTPLLQQTFIKDSTSRELKPFFNRSHTLNGYGIIANSFVRVASQLTLYPHLELLTLIPFSKILIAKGLLRPYKAWCPICYQDWRKNRQVIYDPLLWSLDNSKICLIHQRPLLQNCPHCNRQSSWLNWKSILGYCSCCFQWLGGFSEASVSNQEIWIVKNLGELFANTERLYPLLIQDIIKRSLMKIVHQTTEDNIAAFAKMHKIPKNTLWGWYTGQNSPSLSALLKVCYSLRISFSQFLEQDFEPSNDHHQDFHVGTEYPTTRRLSPKTPNLNQIENTLTTILSEANQPLPTVTEIARQLQIDRRVLSRHFPELCHQIVAKRRDYTRGLHLAAIDRCCQEIKEAIALLRRSGENPTESRVCELISNPGYFRYQKVRLLYKKEARSIQCQL
jgi:transcriptional regulator with XRE-family HTH domain